MVDVGGGDGTLLAAVLSGHPDLRGIVFDTAAGVAQAPDLLAWSGVADRCEVALGDFFTEVPEGDLHLLKSIVHDWDDDRVVTLLGHCSRALPDRGRVLIVEPVLPEVVEPGAPGLSYLSDLNMLVNIGGRERTRADFEDVCWRAGLDRQAPGRGGDRSWSAIEVAVAGTVVHVGGQAADHEVERPRRECREEVAGEQLDAGVAQLAATFGDLDHLGSILHRRAQAAPRELQ